MSADWLRAALGLSIASMGVLAVAASAGDAGAAGAGLPPQIVAAGTIQLLRINGLDVHSRALASGLPPDEACNVLERAWRDSEAATSPTRCSRTGPWLLITHRAGPALQTVQLQAHGPGSTGFLSELDPLAVPGAPARPQLPLPAGTRVLNVVQSIEAGDVVSQFTLRLPWSPAMAMQRLRSAARERGWTVAESAGGSLIEFQRGAIAARVMAGRALPGTSVVLIEHQSYGLRP
ncbi:MAG: hypothetical protein JSR15_09985 [Proteobacteria bacterium]|nr:hypothetical protein [Pseudomonadota bacterium]